ncbi:MAG: phosphotransacetylase family protein [Cyanobacteria bacterium]|nr:phosphotransacetylase family protein [Cyanobacteriota bacterium]
MPSTRVSPSASPEAGPGSVLLVGSCEPFSGKSALVLGLARHLIKKGVQIRFGKPLGTSDEAERRASGAESDRSSSPGSLLTELSGPSATPEEAGPDGLVLDADVRFVGEMLALSPEQLLPSLHLSDPTTARQRLLTGELDAGLGLARLQAQLGAGMDQITLLEAAGSLSEGLLYGLSLPQLAHQLQAPVVLVHPWNDARSVDPLLDAFGQLGPLLAGVVLNRVAPEAVAGLLAAEVPALEQLGIPVLGVMPRSPLLRSVTVEELARRLEARVLCCRERLDLLVETLSIGAMNVNSAMEFFRRRRNMAVVTGADRTDIQLAALEASTQCLILTGAGEPLPQLISRAEELDVPLLKVDHDTLTTVEVIERTFGHVRLNESVKATYAFRLVEEHCQFDRLDARLRLPVPA